MVEISLPGMQKKTKKQKLLAQKHRSTLPPVVSQSGAIEFPSESSPHPFASVRLSPPAYVSQQDIRPRESEYLKKDLVKTIVLTTIILVGEFLLSGALPQ